MLAAHVGPDDDYAGLGAGGPGGHGGVYGDDDAGDGRVAPEPGLLDPLAFPEGVFVLVGDLGVDLLLSDAGAVVAVDDPVEERGREVVLVIEGGASCDMKVPGLPIRVRTSSMGLGVVVTTERGRVVRA